MTITYIKKRANRLVLIIICFTALTGYSQAVFRIQLLEMGDKGESYAPNLNLKSLNELTSSIYLGDGKYELSVKDRSPGQDITLLINPADYSFVDPMVPKITITDKDNVRTYLICKKENEYPYRKLYYSKKLQSSASSGSKVNAGLADLIIDQRITTPAGDDKTYEQANQEFLYKNYSKAKTMLNPSQLLTGFDELEKKQVELNKSKTSWYNRANLLGDIYLLELKIDSALSMYKLIAQSDSMKLQDALKLISVEAILGNTQEMLAWIEKAEKIPPANANDSARVIFALLIKAGTTGKNTTSAIDGFASGLESLHALDSNILLTSYKVLGLSYLSIGNESQARKYFNKIFSWSPQYGWDKSDILYSARDFYISDRKIDSLSGLIIDQLRANLSDKSDERAEVLLLREIFIRNYRKYKADKDTTNLSSSFRDVVRKLLTSPSRLIEDNFVNDLSDYDNFLGAYYKKEDRILFLTSLVKGLTQAQREQKGWYDYSYALSTVYLDLSGLYYRIKDKRATLDAYSNALSSAWQITEKDPSYATMINAVLAICPFRSNQDYLKDTACRNRVKKLVTFYSHPSKTSYVPAIVLTSYLESPFIEDGEGEVLIPKINRLYKESFSLGEEQEDLSNSYQKFYDQCLYYYRLKKDDAGMLFIIKDDLIRRKQKLESFSYALKFSREYAKTLYNLLSQLILVKKVNEADQILDTTLACFNGKSKKDSTFQNTVLYLQFETVPSFISACWPADSATAIRWLQKSETYPRPSRELQSDLKELKKQMFDRYVRNLYDQAEKDTSIDNRINYLSRMENMIDDPGKLTCLGDIDTLSRKRFTETSINKRIQGYDLLSECYLLKHDFSQAESYARKALALDTNYAQPIIRLAHALLFANKTNEALVLYKKAAPQPLSDSKKGKTVILEDLARYQARGLSAEGSKQVIDALK